MHGILPHEFDRVLGQETDPEHVQTPRAVLDVRSAAEFAAGHLPRSGHIPAGELPARRAELPRRDRPLLVVAAAAEEARSVAVDLTARGFADVIWLEGSARDSGAARDTAQAVRLWEPNPYLVARIGLIPRGRALDVASGAGRDAVYLALMGFEVDAWDRDGEALDRAEAMARRHGVAISTRNVDLEFEGFELPRATWDLVLCVRFLHRPLLPSMASAVRPGGHLVYETFRRGQELRGHPRRPRFLLEPGELRAAFAPMEILDYGETPPESPALTSRLHARRAG